MMLHKVDVVGRISAVNNGNKLIALLFMRKKHGWRITVKHLERMNIVIAFKAVNINKDLRGLPDTGNGLKIMAVSQKRKIRHRVEFIKVRTGDEEKIPDHQISSPCRKQIRQAIKNIKSLFSDLADNIVDIPGK